MAGFEVTARKVAPLRPRRVRLPRLFERDDARVLRRHGPSEELVELARDADLFLCEATLDAPRPDGGLRGHLSASEANDAFERSGAKRLLLTHRPKERPLEAEFEQVHDG